MALLWEHLPAESRTARAQAPSLEWGTGDYMLWQIEFHLRELIWALQYDRRRPSPRPRPMQTPAQLAEARRRADAALAAREEIDLALGRGAEDG